MHFAEFIVPSENVYFTYLMYKKGVGYRIGTTKLIITHKGGKNTYLFRYKHRVNQERADALWFLGSYKTEKESRYYEQYYSIKYCIPTWIFVIEKNHKLNYDSVLAEKLFKEVDTESGAKRLLKDLFLFHAYPHHMPKCMSRKRDRNFTIFLCGNVRCSYYFGKKYEKVNISHCYSISGSDERDEIALKRLGLKVRKSKDRKGYRIEGVSSDLNQIYKLAEKIKTIMDINIIEKGRFSNISLPMIPASHVLPGMTCFVEDNGRIVTDTIINVEKKIYNGKIYDINVERYHNFIANGIVTHNSIYSWRQARPENINDFIRDYKANVHYLTYNYRSCSEIIAHANGFQQFGQPMVPKTSITGKISVTEFPSQEEEAEQIAQALLKMGNYNNTAIIYRVNTRSLLFEQTFARYRIPYKVVNDLTFFQRKVSKDLLAALSAANNPEDRTSLARVINTPKRGFGDAKKACLLKEGRSYLESVIEDMPLVGSFINLLDEIKGKSPSVALATYLHRSKYLENLEKDSDRFMVEALQNMVVNFETVEDLILASSFIEKDSGEGVNLITAHGSKGLEFDRVFVVGIEEGLWPHKNAEDIDEEFRLYYVAVTRSKRWCNLSFSRKRTFKGSPIEVSPSPLFRDSYKHIRGQDYPL
jgi:DNA helicase-2/ATP-dependent DNA helicase PcrA